MTADRKSGRHGMWLGMMGLSLLCSFAVQSADNLHFRGALVAEPCVIPPGEENIQLDFGTVIDKYLYLNQRTRGQQFAIHLAECDLTLGSTGVRITFRGNENLSLPGLLALDAASQASGIAIGIEAADGKPLPLNHAGHQYPLAKGSNLMVFKAYVEGEPEALANKTIQRGPFNAVATFSLDYE